MKIVRIIVCIGLINSGVYSLNDKQISLGEAFVLGKFTAYIDRQSGCTIQLAYPHFQNDKISYKVPLESARRYIQYIHNNLNTLQAHPSVQMFKSLSFDQRVAYLEQGSSSNVNSLLHIIRLVTFFQCNPSVLGTPESDYLLICPQKLAYEKQYFLQDSIAMKIFQEDHPDKNDEDMQKAVVKYLCQYHHISHNRFSWLKCCLYTKNVDDFNRTSKIMLLLPGEKVAESIVQMKQYMIQSIKKLIIS